MWFCLCSSQKVLLFCLFFLSRANKKILLQTGKGIPKSLWWKIEDRFFFGGGLWVGGRDVCHYVNFWRRIRRTCFPAKNCLFNEIRKLKEEEEEWKEKQLLIRPLKMCFVVLQKLFYMRISEFLWKFFAIFKPENSDFNIYKDCLYVEMGQIRQNLISNFSRFL